MIMFMYFSSTTLFSIFIHISHIYHIFFGPLGHGTMGDGPRPMRTAIGPHVQSEMTFRSGATAPSRCADVGSQGHHDEVPRRPQSIKLCRSPGGGPGVRLESMLEVLSSPEKCL